MNMHLVRNKLKKMKNSDVISSEPNITSVCTFGITFQYRYFGIGNINTGINTGISVLEIFVVCTMYSRVSNSGSFFQPEFDSGVTQGLLRVLKSDKKKHFFFAKNWKKLLLIVVKCDVNHETSKALKISK